MRMKKFIIIGALCLCTASLDAKLISRVPMDVRDGIISETVSGSEITLYGRFSPENIDGAIGKALRFDGYSTYAFGNIAVPDAALPQMTFAVWVAPETYPVVRPDTPTDEKICIAGTLDEETHTGWRFCLGYDGKYGFESYSGGWKISLTASDALPCYEWSRLVCVMDGTARTATLYRNGEKVGETKIMTTVDATAPTLYIGKDSENRYLDAFLINTFNGLIDDIEVYDTALSSDEIASVTPECAADLSIPASRFADNPLRPKFHGMPAAGWTNECHGMAYSDGRYHLFFQKNANGPFMTRLHWGHISSENLVDWREEKIAIAPALAYDIKGCWSGCVFSDDEVTGGKPNIIYTAVDYAKASIALATPEDESLIGWEKNPSNPIITGRPSGLSDDFRDPYFFRNGDDAYIIVGTSKDGVGACTLHKYNPTTQRWSNDGKIFFSGTTAAQCGRFWEMSNITKMDNGKWLFTTTPLDLQGGVRTIYWTGDIAEDGTFVPDANSSAPRQVELIAREGFGLLSPTLFQKDGVTTVLGIVPDKLSGSDNANLGWAHLYSFPREWSLDSNNNLLQRPSKALKVLRSETAQIESDIDVEGDKQLNISGRQAELRAEFTVGTAPFGFRFFKGATGEASVTYNPASNQLKIDLSALPRLVNDASVFSGVYSCTLPENCPVGSQMTLDVFIDGSIIDVFVNDKWATSVRAFPTADDADGFEVFSTGGKTRVSSLGAWTLQSDASGSVDAITGTDTSLRPVNVYTLDGVLLKRNISPSEARLDLDKGIYIIGDKKVKID